MSLGHAQYLETIPTMAPTLAIPSIVGEKEKGMEMEMSLVESG